MVYTDTEGYKSVEYTQLIAVMVGKMQDQDREFADQMRQIENLETRLQNLENLMNKKVK